MQEAIPSYNKSKSIQRSKYSAAKKIANVAKIIAGLPTVSEPKPKYLPKGFKLENSLYNSSKKTISTVIHRARLSSIYKYDWLLVALVFLIVVSGLAFLSSALSSNLLSSYQADFGKQFLFALFIGGGFCFFLARLDYHNFFKITRPVFLVTLIPVFFLSAIILVGKLTGMSYITISQLLGPIPFKPYESNGALRWVSLGFTNFQPAELAKLTMLIYLSSHIQRKWNQKKEKKSIINKGIARKKIDLKFIELEWSDLARPLLLISLVLGGVLIQPDLGSVIISAVILIFAMWTVRVHPKVLITLLVLGAIVTTISIAALSYRSRRVGTFLDFYTSPETACDGTKAIGNNFQVCQIRKSISEGGLIGKGFGESDAKAANSIPEISTDAILAVIGEEVGFVGTILFLILYLLLFLRGMQVAWQAPDTGGRALASGIVIWILVQALVNVAGVTGLIPLKGTPLPFVSEGGSAIVLNMMAMGILINISGQRISKLEAAKF
jgi:cell division protein FtsW